MPLAPGIAFVPSGSTANRFGASPGAASDDRFRVSRYPNAATADVVRGGPSAPTVLPATVTNLYIRKTGSDSNGGSSNGTAADRTGTDGVTNGTTTFTSASGAFTAADVNKLVNIVTKGRYRIVAVGGPTSVTLSGSPTAGSSLTWNLGGAVLTIAALLTVVNTPAGSVLGGDRIWIGAGTYRETVTVTITPTFEIQINGDVDGAMTGDPGEVRWTAWTSDTVINAGTTVTLGSKSNLTFQRLIMVGGNSNPSVVAIGTGNSNITFRDCLLAHGQAASNNIVQGTTSPLIPSFHLYERCTFLGCGPGGSANGAIQYSVALAPVDYDMQIELRNCQLLGHVQAVRIGATGAGAGKPGGIRVNGCSFVFNGSSIAIADANFSTMFPMTVRGSLFNLIGGAAVNANTTGEIVEDGNLFNAQTARTNVVAGPNSKATYMALFYAGQETIWGGNQRTPFSPVTGSPLLAFSSVAGLGADLYGNPRPAGGGSPLDAAGALERGQTVTQATSPVPPSGTNVWRQTGPGYEDFQLPVSAASTAVTVSVQRDASYAGPLPQIMVLQNFQIGVAAQIAAMSGPTATWETLTLPAFTPTTIGAVTIRMISYDTSGVSVVSFANVTVT